MVTLFLTGNNFSLMVKFDEVRTGGNMMPTATLAVGTTEGKISGERKSRKWWGWCWLLETGRSEAEESDGKVIFIRHGKIPSWWDGRRGGTKKSLRWQASGMVHWMGKIIKLRMKWWDRGDYIWIKVSVKIVEELSPMCRRNVDNQAGTYLTIRHALLISINAERRNLFLEDNGWVSETVIDSFSCDVLHLRACLFLYHTPKCNRREAFGRKTQFFFR